jgi:hypothetical protein
MSQIDIVFWSLDLGKCLDMTLAFWSLDLGKCHSQMSRHPYQCQVPPPLASRACRRPRARLMSLTRTTRRHISPTSLPRSTSECSSPGCAGKHTLPLRCFMTTATPPQTGVAKRRDLRRRLRAHDEGLACRHAVHYLFRYHCPVALGPSERRRHASSSHARQKHRKHSYSPHTQTTPTT